MYIFYMDTNVCPCTVYFCSFFNCLLSPPSLLYSLLYTLLRSTLFTYNCLRRTSFDEAYDLFQNGMIYILKSCDHLSSDYFFCDPPIKINLKNHIFWLLLFVLNLEPSLSHQHCFSIHLIILSVKWLVFISISQLN